VVSITPRPRFTPGKEPPVPIVQEAGWAPEQVWTQRLEEKSSASVGDRTRAVHSVEWTLHRLSYRVHVIGKIYVDNTGSG
jgi:hypothetical protein